MTQKQVRKQRYRTAYPKADPLCKIVKQTIVNITELLTSNKSNGNELRE